RAAAQAALDALESQLNPQAATRRGAERPLERKAYRGRTWVTRRDVFVDRMASAWLIRRFVDVAAKLKFVVEDYRPRKGELRFDMFDGEFTHEGDRCSFETLLRRFGLDDAALVQLGEIVHNIDMKDEKFVRPDVPGIEQLLLGLVRAHREDSVRVERASALFDDLYAAFSSGSRPARQSRGTARRR
ncbi:MAG: chromate resistance protein ChrB domain-containing protein, partial [Gemmatimonadota bacterium]